MYKLRNIERVNYSYKNSTRVTKNSTHKKIPMSEKNKQSLKIAANRPEVLERNRSPRSEKASKTMKEVRNSPEVKEKCNKPRSEKGKLNIKLGQQKRRENEKRGLING